RERKRTCRAFGPGTRSACSRPPGPRPTWSSRGPDARSEPTSVPSSSAFAWPWAPQYGLRPKGFGSQAFFLPSTASAIGRALSRGREQTAYSSPSKNTSRLGFCRWISWILCMMSLRVIDSSFGSTRKTIRFSHSDPTARASPEAFRLLSDSSERINTLGRRRVHHSQTQFAERTASPARERQPRCLSSRASGRCRHGGMENSLWRTLEAPVPRFRDPCDRRRLPPRSDGCGSRAGAYAGGPDRVRPDRSFLRDGRLPGATRPRDWRVLVPIETECLLLLAAIIASNLIFALGGDRCIAASVTLMVLAATVMVVSWQVLGIIGPEPAPEHAAIAFQNRVLRTALDGCVLVRSALSR